MKHRPIKNRFPELDVKASGLSFYGFDGKLMSLGQWTSLIEHSEQTVTSTFINGQGKKYWISTVLLGMDYSFGYGPRPILFETMVFESGPNGIREIMGRYSTIQQARKGHRKAVQGLRLMLTERRRMYGPLLSNGRKP